MSNSKNGDSKGETSLFVGGFIDSDDEEKPVVPPKKNKKKKGSNDSLDPLNNTEKPVLEEAPTKPTTSRKRKLDDLIRYSLNENFNSGIESITEKAGNTQLEDKSNDLEVAGAEEKEVEIWIPNKKYKGAEKAIFGAMSTKSLGQSSTPPVSKKKSAGSSFAAFDDQFKTPPPAFVRKTKSPKTEPKGNRQLVNPKFCYFHKLIQIINLYKLFIKTVL